MLIFGHIRSIQIAPSTQTNKGDFQAFLILNVFSMQHFKQQYHVINAT